ncbi:MAG: signal recognition particle-docking protein FtsY [Candidatus Diapherotrites archaeon]|nr:signal recognition particle-docking protein FtsY [Candidatus Diapherotrites archaeon]
MFGFLKKKIAGFSEKLKQTLEKKTPAEAKTVSEESKKAEEEKQKKEQPVQTVQSSEKEQKEAAKKEEAEKPKSKKEEKAGEMEKKLFEEIGAEIEEEEKKEQTTGSAEGAEPHERMRRHRGKKIEGIPEKTGAEKIPEGGEEEVGAEELEEIGEAIEEEKKGEGGDKEIEEAMEEEKEKTREGKIEEIKREMGERAAAVEIKREEKQKKKFEIKKAGEDKRELKAKVGVKGNIFGRIFGGVAIKESEVSELLSELELSLIESDVEQGAARELVAKIKERIVGQKVSLKSIDEFLKEQIKEILVEMMKTEEIDLLQRIKEKKKQGKPYKILMLGPNGAGKTTTIAKLANHFQKNNLSVIIAAGDTFRAAAIDQIEVHAKRLGVRLVKHKYGGDPTAVAFDAVKAAEANKIDVVMIDSAGRQETNKNLMEELKKMGRVVEPDLKLYVGEAYAGQGLLEQAKEFDDAVGLDGFILTKIDTDAKGGTTISLLYKLKKPILYVGTGQGYDDFQKFTPEFVLNRII